MQSDCVEQIRSFSPREVTYPDRNYFFRAPGPILRAIFLSAANKSAAVRDSRIFSAAVRDSRRPLENYDMLNCPDGVVVRGMAGYDDGLGSSATAVSRNHLNMTNTKRLSLSSRALMTVQSQS